MIQMNKMREIRLEKVTINIGRKETGDEVDKAYILLENLTGSKPVKTLARKKARTFGIREGLPIGVKVTLRGKKAEEFLKKAFESIGNKIRSKWFTENGNFSFGIEEYLKFKGAKYDPKIGIMGFEICVSLERPGYSIKRKLKRRRIGRKHLITKEEAIEFIKNKFNVEVEK